MEGPRSRTRFGVILGLETSCDETAAALVTEDGRILANIVSSQAELHARYGGVVPEVASRHHLELLLPALRRALEDSGALDDVDRVAVTQGLAWSAPCSSGSRPQRPWPGRGGCRSSRSTTCTATSPPLPGCGRSVRHSSWPEGQVQPPFLCLLASGGHTLLLDVRDHATFEVLGTTLDDAAGEAFDKGAAARPRLPGRRGRRDPEAFSFPVARVPGLDFPSPA